jgi:hypothetical protein
VIHEWNKLDEKKDEKEAKKVKSGMEKLASTIHPEDYLVSMHLTRSQMTWQMTIESLSLQGQKWSNPMATFWTTVWQDRCASTCTGSWMMRMSAAQWLLCQHVWLTRSKPPHIHVCCMWCPYVISTLYQLLGESQMWTSKDTFLVHYSHNITPKRNELKIPLLLIKTVFHRALASCCSRKLE